MITLIEENQLFEIEKIALKTWPSTYGSILSKEQLNFMLQTFYNPASLIKNLEKGSLFHVYKEDNNFLGFSEIRFNENEHLTKLHKLYVLPESQGKAIGKKLLENVFKMAKLNLQNGVFLNVNRYNPAKQFYEKIGFHVVSEVDIAIGNGFYMNDYVMQHNFE